MTIKESKWIKCSERMPSDDEHVLIYTSGEITEATFLKFTHEHKPEFYEFDTCCHSFSIDEVTHWKPMPKAPEDD